MVRGVSEAVYYFQKGSCETLTFFVWSLSFSCLIPEKFLISDT
jgi:hypothetical protein